MMEEEEDGEGEEDEEEEEEQEEEIHSRIGRLIHLGLPACRGKRPAGPAGVKGFYQAVLQETFAPACRSLGRAA